MSIGAEDAVPVQREGDCDPCFRPFISEGWVSLTGKREDERSVHVLRDTACSQSLILSSALPLSSASACGYSTVLQGVEMGYMPRPLHNALCVHV